MGRNAIGGALLEGKRLFERNDIDAPRAVIDFSGDSIGNSSGPSIAAAREEVLAAGIRINALPVLRPEDGRRREPRDLRETLRRKLVLEIAGPAATRRHAAR